MVLQNYVVLEQNKPARLHFIDHDIVNTTIVDPITRRPKVVSKLVFQADELNGGPIAASYSILSEKHARDFAPYLPGNRYRNYDFIVTMSGEGHLREYMTQAQLRLPKS